MRFLWQTFIVVGILFTTGNARAFEEEARIFSPFDPQRHKETMVQIDISASFWIDKNTGCNGKPYIHTLSFEAYPSKPALMSTGELHAMMLRPENPLIRNLYEKAGYPRGEMLLDKSVTVSVSIPAFARPEIADVQYSVIDGKGEVAAGIMIAFCLGEN